MALGYIQLRDNPYSPYHDLHTGMGKLYTSPDGNWLAFNNAYAHDVGYSEQSAAAPSTVIFSLNSTTGQIGPIAAVIPNYVGQFAWHPTMNWLAIRDQGANHAWVYPFNSTTGALGTPIQAPSIDGYSYWQTVIWSPDGDSLMGQWSLDYSFGSGIQITTIRGQRFNPGTGVFGTQFSGTGFSQSGVTIWDISPDGNHLIAQILASSKYSIVSLPFSSSTGTGSPELNGGSGNTDHRLDEASGTGDVHFTRATQIRWTPDGLYLMFSSNAAGDGQPLSMASWSAVGPTVGTRIAPPVNAAINESIYQTISADSTYIAFECPGNHYPAVYPWSSGGGTYGTQATNPAAFSVYQPVYLAFGGQPGNCVIAAGMNQLTTGGFLTGSPWSWGANSNLSHTTDALLIFGNSKTHTTDALLRAGPTKTHTTDALLYTLTPTHRTVTHTTDAFLRGRPRLTHTTDALLKAPARLLVFGTDALLAKPQISSELFSSECPPEVIDELGRIGIGVNQPPGYALIYPLVDPTPDIQYLLADVQLTYEDPADYNSELTAYQWPLSIASIYGLGCIAADRPFFAPGPVHPVDILIVDANGRPVFDSTLANYYYQRTWGPRLELYEWRTATAVLRLQSYTVWSPDNTPAFHHYRKWIAPGAGGILDSRTWYRLPKRVKSLLVGNTLLVGAAIDFTAGYNTALTPRALPAKPGQIAYKQLIVDAAPGDGLGTYPGCIAPERDILTINDVSPNQYGDFLLAATDCYWIRQPSVLVANNPRSALLTPAALEIGNDCGPCCTCDDFLTVYNQLAQVAGRYQSIGKAAQQVRSNLQSLVATFKQVAQCVQNNPLQLQMLSATCGLIQVNAQFANTSDVSVGPVTLSLAFGNDDNAIGIDPNCGTLPAIQSFSVFARDSCPPAFHKATLTGSYPNVRYTWPTVRPRDYVSIRFVIQVANAASSSVFATLTGSVNGQQLQQNVQGSDQSVCPGLC